MTMATTKTRNAQRTAGRAVAAMLPTLLSLPEVRALTEHVSADLAANGRSDEEVDEMLYDLQGMVTDEARRAIACGLSATAQVRGWAAGTLRRLAE